jgi:hypothetical protein
MLPPQSLSASLSKFFETLNAKKNSEREPICKKKNFPEAHSKLRP